MYYFAETLNDINVGPSGQANKLQIILVTIDYIVSQLSELGATAEQRELAHSTTVTRTRGCSTAWKKGITKEKAAQAMRKEELVSENLQSPAEVQD